MSRFCGAVQHMSGRPTRHIVDDVNHDELIGAPGGGVAEAPSDATTYGRADRAWTRVLPLGGGELSGPLNLPNGTLANPSLQFGMADGTGLSRSANALSIAVQGVMSASFFANSMQSYGQFYMLGNKIVQVADATAAGDALNLRTGDARYAPGLWQSLEADPGWTTTLRYRRVAEGLQLDGTAAGALVANAKARIGVLPATDRPAYQEHLAGVVFVPPSTYGAGMLEIDPDGQVWTYWSIDGAGSLISLSGVVAMD
jgi:hypothetical protein